MKLKVTAIAVAALLLLAVAVSPIAGEIHTPVEDVATPTTAPPRPVPTPEADEPGGTKRSAQIGSYRDSREEAAQLPIARRKARAAGTPKQVSREFASAWINRPSNKRELARQNRRLISLSQGFWADRIAATLDAKTGSGARGGVVSVRLLRRGRRGAEALVTTREQLAPGGRAVAPYHYGLYLARLERLPSGFAISSWEPQF